MQIGDLSARSGVKIETIRYYERVGLLPRPDRLASGRRIYGQEDVRRLGFVRHARDMGFDLSSVRVFLSLKEKPDASCGEAIRIAQAQLDAVEERMSRLADLRTELKQMIAECDGRQVADCRIIETIAG
ncbi:MerR family transcriptional regulator [Agrobacterium vitis]|uniref:MerR family transcriptional regulator n=1 Tax=Agrobacterium vitis TaxID=373 RepID=UPI001F488797|nr:helix-turn-helix domain-containing protein [Agrobacterium vitis]MCE6077439.1 MerR family transcriptional regulator [Agrobacterium vitis]